MVTNDRQQIVSGDLGWTLFGQERSHVEALQWEGDVAADLERIHDLVPEAFQVNAQNLQNRHLRTNVRHPTTSETKHVICSKKKIRLKKIKGTSGSLSTLQYLTPFLNL